MTGNRGHSGGRARTRSAAVRYQAVCSPVQNDPNGTCTYGLECLTDRQGAWVQWDLIEDVSPSRESVLSLAARCNALGLSPLHFRDVVLDSINT